MLGFTLQFHIHPKSALVPLWSLVKRSFNYELGVDVSQNFKSHEGPDFEL